MQLFVGVTPDKVAIILNGNGEVPTFAFSDETVNPSLFNLLTAAALLYKVASNTRDMIESLTQLLEASGLDAAVPSLLTHQSAIHTAMRCATEGAEKVWQKHK